MSYQLIWSGCPKNNMQNIQYTVAPQGSKPNDSDKWHDVLDDMKDGVLIIFQDAISNDCLSGKESECRVF